MIAQYQEGNIGYHSFDVTVALGIWVQKLEGVPDSDVEKSVGIPHIRIKALDFAGQVL